jgi:hypothetical protein
MRIDSSGRVGIGTTAPNFPLEVVGSTANTIVGVTATTGAASFKASNTGQTFYVGVDNSANSFLGGGAYSAHLWASGAYPMVFSTNATERARIDSSGRLLVGTSTALTGTDTQYSRMVVTGNTSGASAAIMSLSRPEASTSITTDEVLGIISFADSSAGEYGRITCAADANAGSNDYPGRLVFSTTADGASSPTERMRIRADGSIEMGKADSGDKLAVLNAASQGVISAYATNASYAATATYVNVSRAANTAYSFIKLISGDFADTEFHLRGDGNAFADGTWSGGGADYAEYFEWSDGNPDEEDRRGISVVLDGNQIRPAVDGEDPIGVISGNPSVVGDAAWNKWSGKYLRDDYGTYILEDYEVVNDEGETVIQQRRKLNPAYDPDQEYVNREDRPEWDCVGLMGKLRIRKGQPTGSRWIKMRDISDSVEEWLVR